MTNKNNSFSIFFPDSYNPMDDAVEIIYGAPDDAPKGDEPEGTQEDIDMYYYRLEADKT